MCWSMVHKWLLFSPAETELLPYSQLLSAPRCWRQSCLQTSGTRHNLNSISAVGACHLQTLLLFFSSSLHFSSSCICPRFKFTIFLLSICTCSILIGGNCIRGGAWPPRMLIIILIITDKWNKLNLEKMVWNWTEIIWVKWQLNLSQRPCMSGVFARLWF